MGSAETDGLERWWRLWKTMKPRKTSTARTDVDSVGPAQL